MAMRQATTGRGAVHCGYAAPRVACVSLRHGGLVLLSAVAALTLLLLWTAPALAREGDSQTTLFVGTTRFMSDDATSYGTTFGGSYGYEFIDDLLWSVGLAFSTTDGTATVNDTRYNIYASTTTLQTGPTYYFNRTPKSLVIPFIGAGLSVLNYDVRYDFPGSKLGKTSGTGLGGYGQVGVELWLTRSTTLILAYQAAAHDVKTQAGDHLTLRSGGLQLSLRIGIRL
jgi:outer membrane protein W